MEIIEYTEEHRIFREAAKRFFAKKSFPMQTSGKRPA